MKQSSSIFAEDDLRLTFPGGHGDFNIIAKRLRQGQHQRLIRTRLSWNINHVLPMIRMHPSHLQSTRWCLLSIHVMITPAEWDCIPGIMSADGAGMPMEPKPTRSNPLSSRSRPGAQREEAKSSAQLLAIALEAIPVVWSLATPVTCSAPAGNSHDFLRSTNRHSPGRFSRDDIP